MRIFRSQREQGTVPLVNDLSLQVEVDSEETQLPHLTPPTHYKVPAENMFLAGICRAFDCTFEEHEHPEVQVSLLFSGAAPKLITHDGSGKTISSRLRNNSFVFLTSGQPHQLTWREQGEVLHLWMSRDDLCELSEQTRCPVPVSQLGDYQDRGIYEIGRMLVDEFDATGGLTSTMINHAMSLILSRVLRVSERMSREASIGVLSLKRLQPAVNLIHDCPEKNFTLLELASLCNASVFHFARSFTARVGCAPFAFQRELRLNKAQQLLLSTELSIEAIGASVGFENATHFSRMFRRETGYSPRAYKHLHDGQASRRDIRNHGQNLSKRGKD